MTQKRFRSLLRSRFFIIMLLILQMSLLIYLFISSSLTSAIIGWIMTGISFLAAVSVIARKNKGAFKLTWVFMILSFPLFGGLFYIVFHIQIYHKKINKKIKQLEKKAHNLYVKDACDNKMIINALPHYMPQINYLNDVAGFPIYSNTQTEYLTPGEVKFEYLIRELEKAEKYIFLEYFIIQEGKMWNCILDILKKKISEGVLVRIIYDDMGCFLTLPKNYDKYLQSFGIECAVFNPFRPILSTVQNNRDHRKIAIIDGEVAFTGGVNLADEYINEIDRFGHWKDSAVMLRGNGAWSLTLMHLQMWELCTGIKEDYTLYYPWNVEKTVYNNDGFVQPYCDSPMDDENVSEHVYLHILNTARKYVYINTPYLILDDTMVSALCLAAKSGIDVRIITPHTPDKKIVHITTRSYYRELIKAGVRIYEYSKGFLHSKTFVCDDSTAVVGTVNLDFRSLYLHFECGVRLYECSSVADIKNDFLRTLESCREISSQDCKSNIFSAIFQDIMRIFAPLM